MGASAAATGSLSVPKWDFHGIKLYLKQSVAVEYLYLCAALVLEQVCQVVCGWDVYLVCAQLSREQSAAVYFILSHATPNRDSM